MQFKIIAAQDLDKNQRYQIAELCFLLLMKILGVNMLLCKSYSCRRYIKQSNCLTCLMDG